MVTIREVLNRVKKLEEEIASLIAAIELVDDDHRVVLARMINERQQQLAGINHLLDNTVIEGLEEWEMAS